VVKPPLLRHRRHQGRQARDALRLRHPGHESEDDAYFDGKGQELLFDLLLAAAAGDRPISDVLVWLTSVEDETPVELLHDNGYRPTLERSAAS
jgi:hypothetical protein